jgi:hypothetical protein
MLFSTAQLLLMIAAATIGTAGGFAIFDAYRARLRAGRGQCSRCGKPWSAAYPDADRFLVQGREVCSPCASDLRNRLPRLLRQLGWVSALGIGWLVYEVGFMRALGGYFTISGMALALAIPVSFGGMTIFALAAAARRNRQVLGTSNIAIGVKPSSALRAPNEEL